MVNLLTVLAIGYAAAILFFFARGLEAGPRGAIFVLLAVSNEECFTVGARNESLSA